jgi:uncharacterized membrane protein
MEEANSIGTTLLRARLLPEPQAANVIQLLREYVPRRIAAKRNHVPGAVWLLLFCVAGWGIWLTSYEAGAAARHSIFERYLFPLLIAIVIALITDIDTPRGGLIALDERPLLELNQTFNTSATAPAQTE